MAKALQCDNCKEFFSIDNRNFSERKSYSDVNGIAFYVSDNLGQELYRSYDICPSCMRHVKDALSVLVKEA